MTALFTRLDALAPALGWTLAHFLWQGALVALALQVALKASRTARARYAWSLAALIAMAALPVATLAWIQAGVRVVLVPATFAGLVGGTYAWERIAVAAWLAGVAILAARTVGGLVLVERLRRGAGALPPAWAARCRALQRRLSTPLAVAFAQSESISGPIVAGWLKPMVLIPAAAIARLPADQLEALVLHELAHVRRLDAFANLAQIVVETLLFYHPAVWWVSCRIRIERENCCDDLAVAAVGDPALYVRALQQLDELRGLQSAAVMAANGGSLKRRCARLLGLAAAPERPALSRTAAVLALSLAGLSLLQAAPVTARPVTEAAPQKPAIGSPATSAPVPIAEPPTQRIAVRQLVVPSLFVKAPAELSAAPAPMTLAALDAPPAPSSAASPAPTAAPPPQAHTVAPVTVQMRPGANTKPDATVSVTNDDRFIGYYVTVWPKYARQTGRAGEATLSCLIDAHGLAERCSVVAETPKNRHFGAAALELRPTFKFDPAQGADGPIASTRTVRVEFTQPNCDDSGGGYGQTFGSGFAPQSFGGGSEGGGAYFAGSNAFSCAGPLRSGTARDITMLDSPVWAAAPSVDDVARAYPAKGAGLEGYAAAHCRVRPKGDLDGCFLIRETPGGHDFGKAALALAGRFRVAPEVASRHSYPPVWVDIPIRFAPPGQARDVEAPLWVSGVDLSKTPKVFPPEAAEKGVTTGRGVARCVVGPDGALTGCTPDEADAFGFSQAAAKLASTLRMNLWSADAAPVIGGVVRVPIRLNLAGAAAGAGGSGR